MASNSKINKRRRWGSGDLVDININIVAETGQHHLHSHSIDNNNCHEKKWPIHSNNFNRSSSSSSSFFKLKRIIGSRQGGQHFSTINIILMFFMFVGPLVILFGVGSNIRNALLNTQSQGMTRPIISSSSSSSSSSIQAAQQQCSNGSTASFGELVHTHYQKMMKVIEQQQQQPHSNNNLQFVHIAKTGGTAIEIAAGAANISWGVCHWHNGKYYKDHVCPPSNEPSRVKTGQGQPPKMAYWHKTSQHYDVRAAAAAAAAAAAVTSGRKHDDDYYDPYANATLFAVVRNPYNRIISEYYYETSRGNTPASILNNATRLNSWVQQLLRPLQGATMGFIQLVPNENENENNKSIVLLPANGNYYQRDSHYLPQYDYFYDGERRVAHHAIHFENLSDEFRALMVQYNLSSQIVLPDVATDASHDNTTNNINTKKGQEQEMSGRHTQNKKLGMHNLTIENTRLIEFVYARDFVFFGYPARTHLLENQYLPGSSSSSVGGGGAAAAAAARRRLEFVHIPQTGGGRLIEMAAAAAQIPWGACHLRRIENKQRGNGKDNKNHQDDDDDLSWCPVANDNRLDPNDMYTLLPALMKSMKNHLWNLPSHYFEKLLPQLSTITLDKSPKELHNPYGDDNAALFVVVRNPYDRVISTYYAVQEEEEKQASNNGMMMMMNNATYMNEWLYRHLVVMRNTISTARQLGATSFPKKPAYYQFAGRFMPQYDFVYDFVYNGTHGQRRVVDHVLHFESLATEFPALMNDYYGQEHRHRPVLPETKDPAKLEVLLECTKSRLLGIANLTLQNVRLIEFVYARDFASFGYKSMTYHLENQYPVNLPPTNE